MKNNIHKINLVRDRVVINLLGEICWGFFLENFEEKIGSKKKVVEALLENLLKEEKANVVEVQINSSEVSMIKAAFIEVKKEIEEWEFETRLGFSISETAEIIEKL